jgi:hypothetical protein
MQRASRVPPDSEKPADAAGFRCRFWKIWSGRRDSNPRPRPWQGRALPLSYTRIREIAGDRSPATGRAMPNAAPECNSRREVRRGGIKCQNPRDIRPIRRNRPKPRGGRRRRAELCRGNRSEAGCDRPSGCPFFRRLAIRARAPAPPALRADCNLAANRHLVQGTSEPAPGPC